LRPFFALFAVQALAVDGKSRTARRNKNDTSQNVKTLALLFKAFPYVKESKSI
jgi:hypothetical protein